MLVAQGRQDAGSATEVVHVGAHKLEAVPVVTSDIRVQQLLVPKGGKIGVNSSNQRDVARR